MEDKRVNRFTTKIGPREFTITGQKSHQHMQKVSDKINDDLDKLTEKVPHLGLEERALLLALNAVSALFDEEEATKAAAKSTDKAQQEIVYLQNKMRELETLVDEVIHERDIFREQADRLTEENGQLVSQMANLTAESKLVNDTRNSIQTWDEIPTSRAVPNGNAAYLKNPLADKKQQFTESPRRLSGLSKTPRS